MKNEMNMREEENTHFIIFTLVFNDLYEQENFLMFAFA